MKIGVIGLGNIAQKAYLPTYSECRHLAEFVLATRNPETRQEIADQYGFTETVGTIEELIEAKIDACFVHVATKVHGAVVRQLLQAGIHVFVDKPLSEELAEVKELQALAVAKNLRLMVGFNRRYRRLFSGRTAPRGAVKISGRKRSFKTSNFTIRNRTDNDCLFHGFTLWGQYRNF